MFHRGQVKKGMAAALNPIQTYFSVSFGLSSHTGSIWGSHLCRGYQFNAALALLYKFTHGRKRGDSECIPLRELKKCVFLSAKTDSLVIRLHKIQVNNVEQVLLEVK